jgi:hypothetical protein
MTCRHLRVIWTFTTPLTKLKNGKIYIWIQLHECNGILKDHDRTFVFQLSFPNSQFESLLCTAMVYILLPCSNLNTDTMCITFGVCHCDESRITTELNCSIPRRVRARMFWRQLYQQFKKTFSKDNTRFSRSAACSPSPPPPYDWQCQTADGEILYPPLPESPSSLIDPTLPPSQKILSIHRRYTI